MLLKNDINYDIFFILIGHGPEQTSLNDVGSRNELDVVKMRFIARWITHHYSLKSLLCFLVFSVRQFNVDSSWEARTSFFFLPSRSASLYDFTLPLWRNIELRRRKITLRKASIKRQNICDLKWQIRHQRPDRTGENREKLTSNAVNFHLSINFNALRRLTKSPATLLPHKESIFYVLLLLP